LIVPISLVVFLLLAASARDTSPEKRPSDTAIVVRTTEVSTELPIETINIAGITEAADSTLVRFQVGGRVTKKSVRLGDNVEQGSPIASLYNPELEPTKEAARNNLNRLNTQLEQAERDFKRLDGLFKQEAVTRQEWETAKTQVLAATNAKDAAQAELDRASQLTSESVLVAPFSGAVTKVMIDIGEVVTPGSPAIRLSNPSAVELKLAVSNVTLSQLKIGQQVKVTKSLEPQADSITGTITEISPFQEAGSLPQIIVSLNADEIAPGVAVSTAIEITAKRGVGVPIQSVLMTGDNTTAVYRVQDGRAELLPVRPLRITNSSVILEEGLNQGDVIVIEGLSKLFDGAKVSEAQIAKLQSGVSESQLGNAQNIGN